MTLVNNSSRICQRCWFASCQHLCPSSSLLSCSLVHSLARLLRLRLELSGHTKALNSLAVNAILANTAAAIHRFTDSFSQPVKELSTTEPRTSQVSLPQQQQQHLLESST
ncbi:uncharacterized protein LOC127565653 [Drosophila albomicans]|uniref:Uncharacterized protein LOC127565653 n=1 Tax=Drosophila albomicans TaxID=7291 RepID=A0A9C6WB04_DROAB|nr:uncharacterized protein LOC127565653 [Drosophila albomicans]